MKMKYTEKPAYENVEVVAKTVDTVTGTIDRKPVSRVLLTAEGGFEGKHVVVNGDGTAIRTVKPIEGELEIFVELVGAVRSLASFKTFSGWTAANAQNEGVLDVYVEDSFLAVRISECATRMCAAHPECDNQWKIVDRSGRRVFLRTVATSLTEAGLIGE